MMVGGQMPNPNPSPDTDDTSDEDVSSGASTVEEVEQFWRSRVSGKDRAHNAAIEALNAKHAADLAAMQGQTAADAERSTKVTDELTTLRSRNAELESQLAVSAAEKATNQRKAAFPDAAEALGDVGLNALGETELTALEARLAPPAGGDPKPGAGQGEQDALGLTPGGGAVPQTMQEFILSNATPRSFGGNTPAAQRPPTSAELERQLQSQEPEFMASLLGH